MLSCERQIPELVYDKQINSAQLLDCPWSASVSQRGVEVVEEVLGTLEAAYQPSGQRLRAMSNRLYSKARVTAD